MSSFRLTLLIVILNICLVLILIFCIELIPGNVGLIIVLGFIGTVLAFSLLSLCLQPTTQQDLSFKVPLVPILPTLSIFVNIYLVILFCYLLANDEDRTYLPSCLSLDVLTGLVIQSVLYVMCGIFQFCIEFYGQNLAVIRNPLRLIE